MTRIEIQKLKTCDLISAGNKYVLYSDIMLIITILENVFISIFDYCLKHRNSLFVDFHHTLENNNYSCLFSQQYSLHRYAEILSVC